MTYTELAKRRSEDFKFLVVCQAKHNYGMYRLLRDTDLDNYRSVTIEPGQEMEQEVEVTENEN